MLAAVSVPVSIAAAVAVSITAAVATAIVVSVAAAVAIVVPVIAVTIITIAISPLSFVRCIFFDLDLGFGGNFVGICALGGPARHYTAQVVALF